MLAEKFEEGQSFHLHETHFDIIMEAPPMLTVLGTSQNTPIQMCCVADHFLGMHTWDHSLLLADHLHCTQSCKVLFNAGHRPPVRPHFDVEHSHPDASCGSVLSFSQASEACPSSC